MSRFSRPVLGIVILAALLLAGCGGGGGGNSMTSPGGTTAPPVTTTDRVLTGTVVSSKDGRGVNNVVVTLGSGTSTGQSAITSDGGKFSINIGSSTDMYDTFSVHTSGAGPTFPPSELVAYTGGQTYYRDAIQMPVAVLNGDTNNLGTIKITELIDQAMPPGNVYPEHDTILIGRVVRGSTSSGVQGCGVTFGVRTHFTATTGKNGYFGLNLGRDPSIVDLFAGVFPVTFSIDTTNSVGGLSPGLQVSFKGQQSTQGSIVVPTDILLDSNAMTLGLITVLDSGSGGGGDVPPPPPPPM